MNFCDMIMACKQMLCLGEIKEDKEMLDEKDLDAIRKIVVPIEREVGSMKEEVSFMKEEMGSMKEEMGSMKEEMGSMKTKMDSLEKKVNSVQLTLENETNRNIRLIAEGHLDLSRKLDDALKVETEKEMLLIRVNRLENELRKAKDRLDEIA